MDCGAGIYCIGSVHLEHAKTEYSSHFHYAIAPFSAAESSHLPTWHRRELAPGIHPNNSVWEYRLTSYVKITLGSSLSQAQEIRHVPYPLHNTFCKFYVSLIQRCHKNERIRALHIQPDLLRTFGLCTYLTFRTSGTCTCT